jgi:hypothetical protein
MYKGEKMSNYVLLYTGGGMPATEAERKKITDEWMAWYKKIDSAVVDQGNPFSPMAKNISGDGKVFDGPVGSMVTGYTIIKAMSLDAAIQLAKSCPALKNGSKISVYETINAMA